MGETTQLALFNDDDFKPLTGSMNKKEIAVHYGVSARVLRRWLTKLGLNEPKMGGRYYTPQEIREIGEKLS